MNAKEIYLLLDSIVLRTLALTPTYDTPLFPRQNHLEHYDRINLAGERYVVLPSTMSSSP